MAAALVEGLSFFPVCSLLAALFLRFVVAAPGGAPDSKNVRHIARLDHLRICAASLVVLYHYYHGIVAPDARSPNPLLNLLNHGSSGVDLFFVISGFIFGVIASGKRIRYFDFLVSRVVRIYPLYLFALLLVFAAHRELYSPLDFGLMLLAPLNNASTVAGLPHFGQLWTIGLEFQFYLIFPFLAAFVSRNGGRYLVGMIALMVGLRALTFAEFGSVQDLSYWTLLGRFDQFAAGMLAACVFVKRRESFAHPVHLVLAVAAALACFQWLDGWGGYFDGRNSPMWIVWPTIEGAVWSYLLLAYIRCKLRMPAILDRGLDKLGQLSFSIYVMHGFATYWALKYARSLQFTGRTDLDAAIEGIFICLPLAVVFSAFTYHLVEKQFFIFRRKYVQSVTEEAWNRFTRFACASGIAAEAPLPEVALGGSVK